MDFPKAYPKGRVDKFLCLGSFSSCHNMFKKSHLYLMDFGHPNNPTHYSYFWNFKTLVKSLFFGIVALGEVKIYAIILEQTLEQKKGVTKQK